eukprot:12095810-Prorocentrum_lima.AAC.1
MFSGIPSALWQILQQAMGPADPRATCLVRHGEPDAGVDVALPADSRGRWTGLGELAASCNVLGAL